MKPKVLGILLCAALVAACGLPSPAPTLVREPTLPAPTLALPTPAPTATALPTTQGAAPTAPPTETPAPSPTPLFPAPSAEDWQDGPESALLTITFYTDFQCPYCALLASVLRQLRREYPADIRLVFRHFPVINLHDKSILAAEAAEAAGAQGQFWEMHDKLFDRQAAWTQLTGPEFRRVLEIYAADLGLDVPRFAADLDAQTFAPKIEAAFDASVGIGIPLVPLTLINDVVYQGPIDHWAFVSLLQLEKLKARQYHAAPPEVIDPFKIYRATLHTEKGDIVIALLAEQAPLTVNNFVFLAREGWYDGVTFHRVLADVAQAGDPSGTGYGGPGYFISDEINPALRLDAPGWVGMANAGPDSNGSQFFITRRALPNLNGQYTLFGQVVSGLEVVNALTSRDPERDPEAPPGDVIVSVTIEEE